MDSLMTWPPSFLAFLAVALITLVLEAFVGEFIFMGLAGALVAAGALASAMPEAMADVPTLLLTIAGAWLAMALACRAAFGGRGARKDAEEDPNEY